MGAFILEILRIIGLGADPILIAYLLMVPAIGILYGIISAKRGFRDQVEEHDLKNQRCLNCGYDLQKRDSLLLADNLVDDFGGSVVDVGY